MGIFEILSAVSGIAPVITKWLGAGKSVQEVADKASEIATQITGKSDTSEAIDALKADPALVLKYQQAMLDQDMQYEKLYTDDKADARARDVAIVSKTGVNSRANWLAAICIAVVIGILAIVVFALQINEFAKGVITTILGVFLNQLTNIYSFEFGTTRRARENTDTLNNLATTVVNGK